MELRTKACKVLTSLLILTMMIKGIAQVEVQAVDMGKYDWKGFSGDVNLITTGKAGMDFIQQVKKQCFLYFTSVEGMSDESACGILGNIEAECSFDPTVTEGGIPWSSFIFGTTGLGLVGFTWPDLQRNLGDLAYDNGVPWTDMDCQLNAVTNLAESVVEQAKIYGYSDPSINSWDDFRKSTNLTACSNIWLYGYERCWMYNTSTIMDKRANLGKAILEEVKSNGWSGGKYEAKNNPPEVYNNHQIRDGDGKKLSDDENRKSKGEDLDKWDMVKEWELEGMPEKSVTMADTRTFELTGIRDMSVVESIRLANINTQIQETEKENKVKLRRTMMAMLGILVSTYGMLILIFYLFDICNPFISISLVQYASFGLFHPRYENKTADGHLTIYQVIRQGDDGHKILWFIFFSMALGILLCTGSIGIAFTHLADRALEFFNW